MHATTTIAANVSNTLRRSPGPLSALAGYLRMLIEVYRESQALRRAAYARWPHIDG
jgi:hypothetical protein